MEIKIIIVNYNTPDLIEKLIESYYNFKYDKYQLIIIDGSNIPTNINKSKELSKKFPNIIFEFTGYNIHHGPGLHYGMKKYNADYFLLMDSDSYFIKEGLIEFCLENIGDKYAFGMVREYGRNRYFGEKYKKVFIEKYLHPNGCFINYKQYNEHKPLIAHGSPFIETMYDFYNKNLLDNIFLRNVVLHEYINIGWNGTCGRFGYNLDTKIMDNLNNNKDIYE